MLKFLNLFILPFLALSLSTFGQQLQPSSTPQSDSTQTKVPQAIFAELFGPGYLFSVNFDSRFSKKPGGLGIRAGLGYFPILEADLFTFPAQLNYLLGNKGKFLEIGLGATYATTSNSFSEDSDSQVYGTMTLGYRKQPVNGGLLFRLGVSPIFAKGIFIPYWPYLSLGYSF